MIPRNRTARRPTVPPHTGANTSMRRPGFPPISAEDKARLGELMKKHFGWSHEPRPMQLKAGIAQIDGEDVMVHAPTGLGKTGIVAAPHALPQNKGRVTIFVSPLIALQEEMVITFEEEYKLSAIAINSTRTKNLKATMQDICAGKYAVVLISPEMLQSRRFVDSVLRNSEFYRRVLSLVVDEAHTVSHWGAQFRKKYGTLGVVRAFLPPKTSVVAMSASLTPRVRRDVLKKLHFGDSFVNIDEGNNRPNVAIVVRPCHRQLGSFADLDFVIPRDVTTGSDIPSTFIYCDKKEEGDSIIDHLRDSLPENLRDLGLIRPFNASLSHRYRKNALQHFRAGNIRVMVCTDAAGMGCNIPNIEVVVQWKLPEKLSMFVQRAGRAARRPGTTGLAVLLVEPTAYTEFIDRAWQPPAPAQSRTSAQPKKNPKADQKTRAPRGYGKAHGRNRGCERNADFDKRDETICLQVIEEAEDEGLICLVQTGDCRRRVIADAFSNNVDRSHTGPCCDLCNPSLLTRTLPGKGPSRKRGKKKDKNPPAEDIVNVLYDWRLATWKRDLQHGGFSDVAILSEERIQQLACVPEFDTERALREHMSDWRWWSRYGHALWRALSSVYNDRAAVPDPTPANVTTRGRAALSTPAPPVASQSAAQSLPLPPSIDSPVPSAPPSNDTAPVESVSANETTRKRAAPSDEPRTVVPPQHNTKLAMRASTSSTGPSTRPSQPSTTSFATAAGQSRAKRARTDTTPAALLIPPPPQPHPPVAPHPPRHPPGMRLPPPLEPVFLAPGATIPDILRNVVPVPSPRGLFNDPSRLVQGPDRRWYIAHPNGAWFRLPLAVLPSAGPAAGRGRGRGRGAAP